MKTGHMPRRVFLRGLGTAIALPVLNSLLPTNALAKKAVDAIPNRMALVYMPNGVHMPTWKPSTVGTGFNLPYALEPLKNFQKDILVLSGLTSDQARAHGDAGGDHARALAAVLTGCHPKKTHGADIRAGISMDQVAAERVGHDTKFPSLELGMERGPQSGKCDDAYSCLYSSTLSWSSPTTPVAKELNPRSVFERLFSNGIRGEVDASKAKRERYNKSLLDFALEDARSLKSLLGLTDQRKLDEYLTSVRELERRLDFAGGLRAASHSGAAKAEDIPDDFTEHAHLMMDMMVLAFRTDLTRVATFMFGNESSPRIYSQLGISDEHHWLSHHMGDTAKQVKISKINRFHVEHFVYFLEKLKGTREGDGTLFDHSTVAYVGAFSDGQAHYHYDLPVVLAGGTSSNLNTGRHIAYPAETPVANLWLSMLDQMGAGIDKLGDSTGRLGHLT